ncbi:hypothetical protein FB451DRAFT_1466358 [Mycena latifolia]|nr:hypothetical protein FB451DRAFT_1466358 [Mycena latifolia]
MPPVYTANATTRPVISTAASAALYKLLDKKKSSSSSALARKTIEIQLEAYEKYLLAPRKDFPSPDSSPEKAPETVDALNQLGDGMLSQHIWEWYTMSYSLLRQALTRLESQWDGPPKKRQKAETRAGEPVKDIDEWIISHEKCLADGERLGDDWHRGLITLADSDAVFPSSTKTHAARTIVRPTSLPGYELLSNARAPKIEIQPSTAAFKRTFERLSDGLLKDLDWSNVFVAGGIVLGTLLALDTAPDVSKQWAASDIDVYIHGLTPKEANAKLEHLFTTFRANLPPGTPTLVVRNSKTVTFYSRYPLRRVQVVLKLVRSPKAVLLNFDLDVCAMGWDGSEFWMLPRAARALETGFSVFTMNLIQGHYLSERRASQEQRHVSLLLRELQLIFARLQGYGIRILPSYIASLQESETKLNDIARGEDLFTLNMDAIAARSRAWTETVVGECSQPISHRDLENKHQLSAEPLGRSCLTGFSLFMRHVALWEMAQDGDLTIDENEWASTEYGDAPESILTYDDTPSYTWGEGFNIPDFKHEINVFNLRQITDWVPEYDEDFLEEHDLSEDGEELKAAARLTYGSTVATVLDRAHDIILPVLVPLDFAAYANRLVGEAQAAAGLKVARILAPAVKARKDLVVGPDSGDTSQGLFLWRIGRELMWQQLDRRIDEVFEALYAFHRINDRTNGQDQETRLLTQLSKRAIRPTVDDEFAAFARWIGRRPIFVDRFYNQRVHLDEIQGQGSEDEKESDE